ncbi:Cyclic nucleotide-binding protein [Pseudocohnilembus persalinus]|uniref:Cyclic nucleotide-binding protein n=1 Tax=Pseudocohnilembus persalinus TaxID=266149 RepID=A0A0V0R8H2_PSEPJ|nr:Cyclic nucleotide-binding protein [Pseudocohnilembus persalinus]|eukprot:KRX10788.1 Cyclic nucleotide-binding protein [Pseudocohnilembus persalinus]
MLNSTRREKLSKEVQKYTKLDKPKFNIKLKKLDVGKIEKKISKKYETYIDYLRILNGPYQNEPLLMNIESILQTPFNQRKKSELEFLEQALYQFETFKKLADIYGQVILQELSSVMILKRGEMNSFVFEKGSCPTIFYVVLRGQVSIHYNTDIINLEKLEKDRKISIGQGLNYEQVLEQTTITKYFHIDIPTCFFAVDRIYLNQIIKRRQADLEQQDKYNNLLKNIKIEKGIIEERVKILQSMKIFSQVPLRDLGQLALHFKELQCVKNQVIYKQGEISEYFYIIIDGECNLVKMNERKDVSEELNNVQEFNQMNKFIPKFQENYIFSKVSNHGIIGFVDAADKRPKQFTAIVTSVSCRVFEVHMKQYHKFIEYDQNRENYQILSSEKDKKFMSYVLQEAQRGIEFQYELQKKFTEKDSITKDVVSNKKIILTQSKNLLDQFVKDSPRAQKVAKARNMSVQNTENLNISINQNILQIQQNSSQNLYRSSKYQSQQLSPEQNNQDLSSQILHVSPNRVSQKNSRNQSQCKSQNQSLSPKKRQDIQIQSQNQIEKNDEYKQSEKMIENLANKDNQLMLRESKEQLLEKKIKQYYKPMLKSVRKGNKESCLQQSSPNNSQQNINLQRSVQKLKMSNSNNQNLQFQFLNEGNFMNSDIQNGKIVDYQQQTQMAYDEYQKNRKFQENYLNLQNTNQNLNSNSREGGNGRMLTTLSLGKNQRSTLNNFDQQNSIKNISDMKSLNSTNFKSAYQQNNSNNYFRNQSQNISQKKFCISSNQSPKHCGTSHQRLNYDQKNQDDSNQMQFKYQIMNQQRKLLQNQIQIQNQNQNQNSDKNIYTGFKNQGNSKDIYFKNLYNIDTSQFHVQTENLQKSNRSQSQYSDQKTSIKLKKNFQIEEIVQFMDYQGIYTSDYMTGEMVKQGRKLKKNPLYTDDQENQSKNKIYHGNEETLAKGMLLKYIRGSIQKEGFQKNINDSSVKSQRSKQSFNGENSVKNINNGSKFLNFSRKSNIQNKNNIRKCVANTQTNLNFKRNYNQNQNDKFKYNQNGYNLLGMDFNQDLNSSLQIERIINKSQEFINESQEIQKIDQSLNINVENKNNNNNYFKLEWQKSFIVDESNQSQPRNIEEIKYLSNLQQEKPDINKSQDSEAQIDINKDQVQQQNQVTQLNQFKQGLNFSSDIFQQKNSSQYVINTQNSEENGTEIEENNNQNGIQKSELEENGDKGQQIKYHSELIQQLEERQQQNQKQILKYKQLIKQQQVKEQINQAREKFNIHDLVGLNNFQKKLLYLDKSLFIQNGNSFQERQKRSQILMKALYQSKLVQQKQKLRSLTLI